MRMHAQARIRMVKNNNLKIINLLFNFSPSCLQSRYGAMPQPRDDGKHGVEVVGLFTLSGHLDQLFDDPHSFCAVGLWDNLTYGPHHLAIYLQKISGVYFDMQMGALHTFPWLKYYFSLFLWHFHIICLFFAVFHFLAGRY